MGGSVASRSLVLRMLTVLSVVATLVVVGVGEASAATLVVPSGAFPTIQSAEDAANPGDVINVKPGTYNENVVVDVDDLTIQKKPKTKGRVLVDGFSPGVDEEAFDIDADDFTLKKVTARNGESDTINCDGSNCRILSVRVLNAINGDCINIFGDGARISGVVLRACGDNGVEIDGDNSVLSGSNIRLTDSSCVDVNGIGALIQKNTIGQCEDSHGIVVDGENPRVLSNSVSGPTDSAVIDVSCFDQGGGANPTVACDTGAVNGNVVTNGAEDDDGIQIDVVSNTGSFDVIGNTVIRTLEHGFDLDMDDGVIRNNVARENGAEEEDGFVIDGNNNTISGNRAIANGGSGFDIDGSTNTISGNVASGNAFDGILLDSGDGNIVNRNTATGNNGDGIENDGTNTDLTNNVSRGNKLDCSNDGSTDVVAGNSCADGSNFTVGSTGIG